MPAETGMVEVQLCTTALPKCSIVQVLASHDKDVAHVLSFMPVIMSPPLFTNVG